MPPSAAATGPIWRRHRPDAGVEAHDAVTVPDQVDVHDLRGEASLHEPDAFGDIDHVRLEQRAREPRARVEGAGHAPLGAAVARRHQADLPRELRAVVIGVVSADQAVLDRQQVDSLQVDPGARGLDALERAAAERARRSASARRAWLRAATTSSTSNLMSGTAANSSVKNVRTSSGTQRGRRPARCCRRRRDPSTRPSRRRRVRRPRRSSSARPCGAGRLGRSLLLGRLAPPGRR